MVYTIGNDILQARIQSLGAELVSVKNKNDREFIYQPGEHWSGQAKNLFPNVGHAKDDYAIIRGKRYPMYQHGFLKDMEMTLIEQKKEQVSFSLHSNGETEDYLPYHFSVSISFSLSDNALTQTYQVRNMGEGEMYFGLASHTGFAISEGSYVDFMGNNGLEEICRKDMKYLTGDRKPYPLQHGILPLTSQLFEEGAHILDGFQKKKIQLINPKLHTAVVLEFYDFDRLTLWSTPDAEAVLCMMPWCALPDFEDSSHIFEKKAGNICLPERESFIVSQKFYFLEL